VLNQAFQDSTPAEIMKVFKVVQWSVLKVLVVAETRLGSLFEYLSSLNLSVGNSRRDLVKIQRDFAMNKLSLSNCLGIRPLSILIPRLARLTTLKLKGMQICSLNHENSNELAFAIGNISKVCFAF
jgi:hypothetical protein